MKTDAVDIQVLGIVKDVLGLDDRASSMNRDWRLLGVVPELDSFSAVAIITAFEERFDITIDADELDASSFETIGTLVDFVSNKISA